MRQGRSATVMRGLSCPRLSRASRLGTHCPPIGIAGTRPAMTTKKSCAHSSPIQLSNSQRSAGPVICGAGAPSSWWCRSEGEGARNAGPGRTRGPRRLATPRLAEILVEPRVQTGVPASRARCEWLALRQPRRTDALARAANLLSSAGDPRPVSRIIAAWASTGAGIRLVPCQPPPHPAPRLVTIAIRPSVDGAG